MTIKLQSDITVTEIAQLGGDWMVAAAARVSSNGNEAKELASPDSSGYVRGLIRSLMRKRHGTPFEHGAIIFFVHAPIFVFREWHRHRVGFSYNEESGRYKQLEPVFWIPRKDRPMIEVEDYKPMEPRFVPIEPDNLYGDGMALDTGDNLYQDMVANTRLVCGEAYRRYSIELEYGVAREVARRLLPVNIYSSCWVTCNPRSLMAFLSLRTHDPEAFYTSFPQAEIEEAARQCEEVLEKYWPITYEAFNDFGRVGP